MDDLAEEEKEAELLDSIDEAAELELGLNQQASKRGRDIEEEVDEEIGEEVGEEVGEVVKRRRVDVDVEDVKVVVSKRVNAISAARAKTSKGQNNQAAKMLSKNKKVINSFNIGDLVLLATENVLAMLEIYYVTLWTKKTIYFNSVRKSVL